MGVPTIDTFEHDIAEEIKTKEASLSDIAAAGGDVKNISQESASHALLILGLVCILLVIAGLIGAIYYYGYVDRTPSAKPIVQSPPPSDTLLLSVVSPTLASAIGANVETIDRSPYGFTLTLANYPSVFSYMLKNEDAFADELGRAVGSPRDTSTTTDPFLFTDVTKANVNMRVGTTGSSTVVYAFVNGTYLLFSSSTEGILSLKSILK